LLSEFQTDDPEEDEEEDPYFLDINFDVALRLIQKNERGRQGRKRALQ